MPALDYGIFEKYGFKPEHIYIRGQSPALAALATDELQFNYGAADGSLPGLAAGVEVKFVASPLVKLPYILVGAQRYPQARGSQRQSPSASPGPAT